MILCLLEVTSPKPGNVHRGADFEDVTSSDFLINAVAVGEMFDRNSLSIGQTVLQVVQHTEAIVGTNTNLGMVVLLALLVAAAKPSVDVDTDGGLSNALSMAVTPSATKIVG